MFEYVRRCSWLGELAFGSCSKVSLRTRRYSEKKVSKTFCFLGVNGNVFSKTHFFKTSPIQSFKSFLKRFAPIPLLNKFRSFLGDFL